MFRLCRFVSNLACSVFCAVFVAVTALSFFLLSSSVVFADDDSVIDQIRITIPVSCTMTGVGMTSHNATINNGQSNSAIGETTLNVRCNDTNGFAIYAIGYTDDTDGKNVLTNASLGSTFDITTGTATSGNASKWAMKLSTISSPTPTYPITIQNSFDSFHNVPDDYTLVAKRTAGTDLGANAEGSSLKTTYQAFISQDQPAGTYSGKVKYVMVHPNDAPILGFNSVYANAGKTKVNGYYKIHDLTYEMCQNVGVGRFETVIDVRDNNTYMIGKLRDGNCWMLENLRLDPTNSTTASNMNASNTNASADAISNYLNGGNVYDVVGWSSIAVRAYPGDSTISHSDKPHLYANLKDNLVDAYGPVAINGQAKMGVFYNYCAATAGTYCYNDSGDENEDILDSNYDICPYNWRMPTGTEMGDFSTLLSQYDSSLESTDNASFDYNFSVALSGMVSTSFGPGGENSDWSGWSSTNSGYRDAYILYTSGGDSASADYDDHRYNGHSIRCALLPPRLAQ